MSAQKMVPSLTVAAALLLSGALGAAPARADDWYLGVATTMESFDADYDKTTINGQSSPRGEVTFHSDDSADEVVHGLGVFAGYRMPLDENGLYLSFELDFMHYGGTVQSRLPEAGNAPGPNEYGESWSEDWSYKKEHAYGLTFRLGMPLAVSWMKSPLNFYGLAGVRRTKKDMHLSFMGCQEVMPCSGGGDDLTPGTTDRDSTVSGWTVGAGFETEIAERIMLRAEIYHTRYESNRWTSYPDPDRDRLRVRAEVDGEESGFSLGVARYF